jgi:peptidoglycan/LPS O-acetylase OafA/YrhL
MPKRRSLSMGPRMKRYESLDGMRGVCAVTVALLHFDSVLLTGFLANYGWLSVDVFFIISGFVIAMKYEDRLRGGFSFGAFIKARAARLLPTQVLGTIVVALSIAELFISDRLNVSEIQILAYVFLCAILLVPTAISLAIPSTYIWKGAFPINPPLWSMQGEWVVNCIYAAGLFAVRSRILFALYTTIAAYLVTHMAHESPPQWDHVVPYEAVPTISRALMGFICGVLFSRLEKRGSLTRLPMIKPEFIFGIWFLICLVPRTHPMPLFEAFLQPFMGH